MVRRSATAAAVWIGCLLTLALPAPARAEQPAGAPADGAPRLVADSDRQFWSFVAPKRVEPPAVRDADWCRTGVDRFILARLESRHLRPAPPAAPAVLARRLTYDLTGLPPTPDEVEAFAADSSAGAYDRLVERLLASPHFGERFASMWLPLARYA